MSTSSTTAAITTAASVASGRSSNSPVRNSSVITVSTATTSPDTCERAPAEPLTAVFDRLPLTTIPLHQPGAEVGRAEADQLAVGVDLVVVAGGVRLGRAEALGEADEHDPRRRAGGAEVVGERRARRAARATAARCRCGRRSRRPWSSRSNSLTATTPKMTATSEPGTIGSEAAQPEHDRQRAQRRRPACGLACRRGGGSRPTAARRSRRRPSRSRTASAPGR